MRINNSVRVKISIHALREEGDNGLSWSVYRVLFISIHALREEGDPASPISTRWMGSNFYPRPPRGGRLARHLAVGVDDTFLSTPSARRATPLRFCRAAR